MGKSKRNKAISLTKTKKKTKSFKEELIEKIKECIGKYENLFVFSHANMRTNPFRDIQVDFNDSKFFLGKNKVMQIALGRTEDEEFKKNLHKISEAKLLIQFSLTKLIIEFKRRLWIIIYKQEAQRNSTVYIIL